MQMRTSLDAATGRRYPQKESKGSSKAQGEEESGIRTDESGPLG